MSEIFFYILGFWVGSGVISYFIGMRALTIGYPKQFNDERSVIDRKFCLRMALGGPINLIVVIIIYMQKRGP